MPFLLTCFTCAAFAQAAAVPAPAAAAPARPDAYLSPFADYRRFDADAPPKPWRQANDEVREAGGHVGILKGMSSPAAATAAGRSPSGGEAQKPAAPKGPEKPAANAAPPGHSHGGHR